MLTTDQIRFLRRLVLEQPRVRRAGAVAQYLCEHHSLGVMIGNRIEYQDKHHQLAEALLRNNDLPVTLPEQPSRAEVAQFGGLSEKAFSTAPHEDSVAVRCIGACTLDAAPLTTPAGAYLVVPLQTAVAIRCERLMLVENLETFRQLERYRWIDYQGLSVLAIYRGDSTLSTRSAVTALRQRNEPIWAFVDFDPSGLMIANSLPADRLERIVLPDTDWLRKAADTRRGRHLFDLQDGKARKTLDLAINPSVQLAWRELRSIQGGVNQEQMRFVGISIAHWL